MIQTEYRGEIAIGVVHREFKALVNVKKVEYCQAPGFQTAHCLCGAIQMNMERTENGLQAQ